MTIDVWTDSELTDLLRADPGLVVIADALAHAAGRSESQGRAHRRRAAYVAAAVLLIVVAALPAVAFSHGLRSFLGIADPPVGRNWVQATLLDPIPRSAPAGRTVVVRWKLWSRDQHGKVTPFGAAELFARIVNPARTRVSTATARCLDGRRAIYCHDGQFQAKIRVPSGGIGQIQVGIIGYSDGPSGRTRAPGLFPITNAP